MWGHRFVVTGTRLGAGLRVLPPTVLKRNVLPPSSPESSRWCCCCSSARTGLSLTLPGGGLCFYCGKRYVMSHFPFWPFSGVKHIHVVVQPSRRPPPNPLISPKLYSPVRQEGQPPLSPASGCAHAAACLTNLTTLVPHKVALHVYSVCPCVSRSP